MSAPWIKEGDHSVPNIILCSLLVVIESLQLLIVLVLIFSFIPIPPSDFIRTLFPRHQQLVFPKRDMFFYRFWVATLMAGQAALLIGFKDQLSSPKMGKQLRVFCMVEAGWLFLMVFAVFKIFVYGYPSWGFYLLYAVLGGSVLSKVFWKEFKMAAQASYAYLNDHSMTVQKAVDIFVPLLIAGLLFVPDLQGVIARMWIGDCLHHMDTALMAQVWAFCKGAMINVDVYEHYGLGMPILIALLAKGLGSVSYAGILSILIWASIIYFILCYSFLRVWLKNIPLAIAGVLMAVKWKMFNPGVYPFIFTYPDTTIIRHFFDIIVLFLLLVHTRRGNFNILMAAGAVCGLALFYVSDTGVYLFLAYIFYLCWLVLEGIGQKQQLWKSTLRPVLCGAATVLFCTFVFFYAFQGAHLWSKDFWANMTEQIQLFLIGHGDLPIYKSLVEGNYLESLMGFIMPLVYGGVFITVVSLCFLKKIDRRNIIVAVICVYGMGLYHYYVCRSAGTSYYSVGIPFVFVLCWLCLQAGKFLGARHRHAWWVIVLASAVFSLFTNHAYLNYPNMFNFSPNPIIAPLVKWPNKDLPFYFNNIPRGLSPGLKLSANSLGQEDEDLRIETDFKTDGEFKDYFKSEFDFREDADLIDRLSTPDQAVALISSFETRILMQADRRSFFYYFPLIDSRPMRMRIFPFTSLLSTHRLQVTLDQLEKSRPPYIFMEKILMAQSVPSSYEYLYPELLVILGYIHRHYVPFSQGHYLIALKRNDQ